MRLSAALRACWSWLVTFLRRRGKLAIGFISGALATLALVLGLTWCRPGASDTAYELDVPVPSSGPGFALALYQTVRAELRPGHEITLLDNGAVFDALIAELGRARSSIHISMYIWAPGVVSQRLSAALIERARAGIACRVLVDAFGSSDFPSTIRPALVDAGCEVRIFRPLPGVDALARNHRKLIVIDGRRAIVGGFGVRDNWLGDGVHGEGWRDSNVLFAGPSVRDAQQAFAANWQEAGGGLLPETTFPVLTGAGATGEGDAKGTAAAAFVASTASPVVTEAERLTQLVIAAAHKRLWITNAYVVPSRAIRRLLLRKAAAGVDVRILAPGSKSDSKPALVAQQKVYRELLAGGIRIWEYTPSMIHGKTMLADDELAVIGSINLDPLSLNKLDEAALVIVDRTVAAALARQFESDLGHADERTR
ncbi:MAG: Cardiolipin synthetase [Myxococcales bacterium]|nr:Cardiolipin synthetase [Myxococcales bacterium]